jgi:hypothetical protein
MKNTSGDGIALFDLLNFIIMSMLIPFYVKIPYLKENIVNIFNV